jgi:biopolymer transport protein ExbD
MFLLATFVLFTLSMNKTKMIETQLPQGGPPPSGSTVDKPVEIGVDTSGDYFWNKERVSFDDLLVRLNGLNQQADPKVVVVGEEGAQFGKALAIIDEARRINKKFKITFNTSAVSRIR